VGVGLACTSGTSRRVEDVPGFIGDLASRGLALQSGAT
jgi:hypothetical protein